MSISEIFRNKLASVDIILTTPGGLAAWRQGCYLNLYKMLKGIEAMGINPKTVLDIGANKGMFTKCSSFVFPDASFYAFEPLDNCFEELSRLQHSIERLKCYNVAIGNNNTAATIHRSSYDYSSSLLEMDELHKAAFPYSAEEIQDNIQLRMLDSILLSEQLLRPLLMKIDVQGYEKFVLEGAKQTLNVTDAIICEISFRPLYKGQPLFDEVYDVLRASGFRFMGHVGQLQHPQTKEILQIDGLFLRT